MNKMNKVKKGEPRRIRITKIHKLDAFYNVRDTYIGLEGDFIPDSFQDKPGYFAGKFFHSRFETGSTVFYGVRYKRLEAPDEQPSVD